MPKITIPAVYYVSVASADKDDFIDPLAIRPHFEDSEVMWEDTSSHGRIVSSTEVIFSRNGQEETNEVSQDFEKNFPDKIVVKANGKTYTLQYLTKELFDAHVREYAARNPSFSSTQDVQNFYLTQYFGL